MVVDGNLSTRLGSEKPQTIFRVTGVVLAMLGKPADTDALDIILFSTIGEFIDLHIFAILPVYNVHHILLFK
jgi:hypothetical protein